MATKTKKTCEVCEREFSPNSNAHRTCSPDCAATRRKTRRYSVERVRNADGSWTVVKETGERHSAAADLFALAAQRVEVENLIAQARAFVAEHPDYPEAAETLRKAVELAATLDRDAERLVAKHRDDADFAARETYPWMTRTPATRS